MPTEALSRWRIALNIALLDDAKRATELAGIAKTAPQSVLIQVPSIAASFASLQTRGAKLAADAEALAQCQKAYSAALGVLLTSRLAFDRELDTMKTLVENNATSANDVTSMGFLLQVLNKASRTVPDAPAALLVRTSKEHGKARVTVAGKGHLGSFVAEVCTDPIGAGPWAALPGTGKQRKLSGYPSGTKLWVHFAAIRFGLQSPWSTPVLVTIP